LSNFGTTSMVFVISNSTPYVAYTSGYPERISVIHYDGSKWEPTGNLKFAVPYDFVSMAIDNGTPYTAFIEQDTHKASVMYFKP